MVGGGLQYHSLPYEQAVRAIVAQFGAERVLAPKLLGIAPHPIAETAS